MISAEILDVALSGRTIVRDLSLAIRQGEVVGLLGPNGAGKSTLIRVLAGHIPYRGRVEIAGHDLRGLAHDARARLVAYLPQQREIAWPLSVENAVALGRMPWSRRNGGAEGRSRTICREAMGLMDIDHLAHRPVLRLSGGEQARVLVARAIAQDTPVLLADEPAAGLDPAHQISMMCAFRQLAANGRLVVVSLHDLTLAARWCDRVVIMDGGTLVASGFPEHVMTSGLLEQVFGVSIRVETDNAGLILTPLGLSSRETPMLGVRLPSATAEMEDDALKQAE